MIARDLRIIALATVACFMLTCSSGSNVGHLLCQIAAASYDTSALTVGLSAAFLDAIRSQGATSKETPSDDVVNGRLLAAINSGITRAGLSELISIKAIQSVSDGRQDDGVRFLELDGKLASATTMASGLLRDAKLQEELGSAFYLTAGERPFGYLEDSFRVRPSLANDVPLTLAAKGSGVDFNAKQWAYNQSAFDTAMENFRNLPDQGDQVVVAVIDTGVDLGHPALANSFLKDGDKVVGFNFVNNTEIPDDDQGHGTHCAGIIGAKKVGDDGMVGVAQAALQNRVKIMPIKVLGGDGSGSTANINKGIRWAIAHGADVISMSLGGAVDFEALQKGEGSESKIIREAVDRGVIIVVAAGNENCPLGGACEQRTLGVISSEMDNYTVLPCSYNGTICVGASDPDVTVAEYSNYPSKDETGVDPAATKKAQLRASPDIVAPGTAIYSTYPKGDYKILSGTSMATPYVAGLAAIFKLKVPPTLQKQAGTIQRTFWKLIQDSSARLEEEKSKTRSFVGQVELGYFSQRLQDFIKGTTAAREPNLQKVEGPEPGTDFDAPNLVSLVCGG